MRNDVLAEQQILKVVEPRFGSAELARSWYDTVPLPGFGLSTAAQLVEDGRSNEVLDYVRAIDAGVHA